MKVSGLCIGEYTTGTRYAGAAETDLEYFVSYLALSVRPMKGASAIRIHPDDNLLIALQDLPEGSVAAGSELLNVPEAIPAKHPFAARALRAGEPVRLYGVGIGVAAADIEAGRRITPKDLTPPKRTRKAIRPTGKVARWNPPGLDKDLTFEGYRRSDGKYGTANNWLVIPLVFCENENILTMREAMLNELGYGTKSSHRNQVRRLKETYLSGSAPYAEDSRGPSGVLDRVFPHVDGIRFLIHQTGCGGTDRDAQALCGLLAGYITHPNTAGATVLSLGCQRAELRSLKREIEARDPDFGRPLFLFEQQSCSSETDMISEALRRTFAGLIEADRCVREKAGIEHLVVGMECGASDAFSGISANPVLGFTGDLAVAGGGSVILSEFSELSGVEEELAARCVSKDVADRFLRLMAWYSGAAKASGVRLDMNASPGNIRDGLVTGIMKSAGAAQKGGTSPIVDVLDYPEAVTRKGLNLLCTPGSDVESTTAMAAAGANIILFSTGLGTPTGNPVCPVIKVSSHTGLFGQLPDLIDFDAGTVITGAETIEAAGRRLFQHLLEVAGGSAITKSFHQDDFMPWKRDVSL